MNARTHLKIDEEIAGQKIRLWQGGARVRLKTQPRMAVDELGLVHGGFSFGLADYAAMLAVNEPNVVLIEASVKFLRPVTVGEELLAEAHLQRTEGTRRHVKTVVKRGEERVLEGEFVCMIPPRHVLE